MSRSGNQLNVDHDDLEDIRIAVVLNGGISLAVWMSGVVNEINSLTRRRPSDPAPGKADLRFSEAATVYGGLLDLVHGRARADVIAGTSAGGINGALLAYAQAYGADLRPLGELWAELGSFDALLRDPREPHPASLLRGDDYFLPQLVSAFERIVPAGERSQRYVPASERPIDLIINTTLMRGQPKQRVDDFGTEIIESAHTGALRFTRAADASPVLDPFWDARITHRLALASRSTASFPVAFEPSFIPVGEAGRDSYHPDMGAGAGLPAVAQFDRSRYVMDGGVLLNQPVKPALAAIYAQPAEQQVRRLLVHVNPDPSSPAPAEVAGLGDVYSLGSDTDDRPPTPAAVLRTLATLPYAQSVDAELTEIQATNGRVRRYRPDRARIVHHLNEKLAEKLMDGYRSTRSYQEADRIGALLAAAAPRPRIWWSRPELAAVLRDVGTRAGGVSYIPPDDHLPAADADPALWAWGVEPVERIGALAVDVFKRAMWLADPTDPAEVTTRRRLRGHRRRLHEALAELRECRRDDEVFWRSWATRPPAPPARGSDATERQECLRSWVQAALSRWPLPPGAKEAPAASLPDRLGAVAERIARVLAEAGGDLRHVAARARPGGPPAGPPGVRHAAGPPDAAGDSDAADEAELLHNLVEALFPDGAQPSPASLLRRLLAVEVCQIAISGAPPEVEQEVLLQQISGFTPNSFGGPTIPAKIAGTELFWFGGFASRSWRVNDWIWGRLDGATRMVQAVLDPGRLRQLGLSAKDTHDQLRRLAVGGSYQTRLGEHFDAQSEAILAELSFLDDPEAGAEPLVATALAVARRLHADILTEELPRLAVAIEEDRKEGGLPTAGARFLRVWTATPDPSLDELFAMFADAEIATESFAEAVSAGLLWRSAAVATRFAAGLFAPVPPAYTPMLQTLELAFDVVRKEAGGVLMLPAAVMRWAGRQTTARIRESIGG
ncbi:Patatin-like protein [Frankia sp. Hr75.2]|nr:Patatin-like protein [Frankia sp. Hr75.2]